MKKATLIIVLGILFGSFKLTYSQDLVNTTVQIKMLVEEMNSGYTIDVWTGGKVKFISNTCSTKNTKNTYEFDLKKIERFELTSYGTLKLIRDAGGIYQHQRICDSRKEFKVDTSVVSFETDNGAIEKLQDLKDLFVKAKSLM